MEAGHEWLLEGVDMFGTMGQINMGRREMGD